MINVAPEIMYNPKSRVFYSVTFKLDKWRTLQENVGNKIPTHDWWEVGQLAAEMAPK